MAVFRRCYRVKIQIGNIIKTYQDLGDNTNNLKIQFNTKISADGVFSEGVVSISGMTTADLAFLGTNFDFSTGAIKNANLSLEVGYQNGISLILSGNIMEADINLSFGNIGTFKIMSCGFNAVNTSISDSVSGALTLKDLAARVAKNNGVALEFGKSVTNSIIKDYSFTGTPFQQIENLRKYTPANVFLANKKLCVLDKKSSPYVKTKIDYQSGLLQTPKPNALGCELLIMLNPNLKVGQFIDLSSLKIPQLNGVFRIVELEHTGSNRGGEWQSRILAYKRGF